MAKKTFRLIDLIYWIAILLFDFAVYVILGLCLMGYDDNYNSSKGEYGSLASMNSQEKVFYFAFNAWIVLNVIGVIYLVYRFFIKRKPGKRLT